MDKTYTPEVISDVAFPLQQGIIIGDTTDPSSQGTTQPTKIQAAPLPQKKIAQELLSQALNTANRKIGGEFGFIQQGALQIGKYQEGINGDIRISPRGILGRNTLGDTTFGLDGETGDAFFAGQIRSGSVVTGDVNIADGGRLVIGSDEDDAVIDENGIVSANNFRVLSMSGGPFTSFTNTTFADVSGTSTISLELKRSTRALISLTINGASEQINPANDLSGDTEYRLTSDIDGELAGFYYSSSFNTSNGGRENIVSKPYTVVKTVTMTAGIHTITVQSRLNSTPTNLRSILQRYAASITLLGN